MKNMRDMYVGIYFQDDASKAIDKIDQAMDNVKDNLIDATSKFNKVERAGINAGAGITKATKEAEKSTQKVGDSAADTASEFSSVQTVGVGAWTAIATAVSGATVGITNLVADYDAAMFRIAAKTGLAGSELANVQDTVKNVFNTGVGTDLATVSDEVLRIKQSLKGLSSDELETFSMQALTVSDLWGQSSENVTWAVKNMTSNFDGLSEHEALDLITVGFQKTGDYAGDLLDTFKEYSPYFSKMGLSAQEFTSILISGAENGAWNLDKVADAVKEFGIRGMDGSKATAEGFKMAGLDAKHMATQIAAGGETANQAFYATVAGLAAMKDEVKRNEAGIALFGTQWEDVREDVILAMGDAKNSVLDFEGAADRATTTATNNVRTKLTSAWRDFKSEMVGIFDSNQGQAAIDGIVSGFTSALGIAKEFSGFVVNNWGMVSTVVLGLGTAVGYVALVMAGMKVIGVINGLMTAYQASTFASTVATHGFNAALRANPIGLVVTAVGLLITAGVMLYKNWDTVKEKTGMLWQKLMDNPLLALAAGPFGGLIAAGITLYKNFDTIKARFTSFKTAITNFKVPKWVSTIGGALSAGYEKVKGWVSGADGSHATGLERVPFDGYRAELHKGEAVLTAKQSNALRNAGILSANGNGTPSLNTAPLTAPPSVSVPTSTTIANTKPSVSISMPVELIIQGNADSSTVAELRAMLKQLEGNLSSKVRKVIEDLIRKELAGLEG